MKTKSALIFTLAALILLSAVAALAWPNLASGEEQIPPTASPADYRGATIREYVFTGSGDCTIGQGQFENPYPKGPGWQLRWVFTRTSQAEPAETSFELAYTSNAGGRTEVWKYSPELHERVDQLGPNSFETVRGGNGVIPLAANVNHNFEIKSTGGSWSLTLEPPAELINAPRYQNRIVTLSRTIEVRRRICG